jgi:hypothetical protein
MSILCRIHLHNWQWVLRVRYGSGQMACSAVTQECTECGKPRVP